jgi:hypothetical protein
MTDPTPAEYAVIAVDRNGNRQVFLQDPVLARDPDWAPDVRTLEVCQRWCEGQPDYHGVVHYRTSPGGEWAPYTGEPA